MPDVTHEQLDLEPSDWAFLDRVDEYIAANEGENRTRRLSKASTSRQFRTAAKILRRLHGAGSPPQAGILLSDDVGLGKTTVAALVAWVFAGKAMTVRVLAPNATMARRWHDEFIEHVRPLKSCAPYLSVESKQVKSEGAKRLPSGSVQVLKHSHALGKSRLQCDLLIIDEAHRAKGEATAFAKALRTLRKQAKRVLILTATPFSIRIDELDRMLELAGAPKSLGPLRTFQRRLDLLYSSNTKRPEADASERLVNGAREAVNAMGTYLIRHGVDHLPDEAAAFGEQEDWRIDVPDASENALALMLRSDRLLRICRDTGVKHAGATNDPRFHVGWRHLDDVCNSLKGTQPELVEPARTVVNTHLQAIHDLRKKVPIHPKMLSVTEAVSAVVAAGEKVVLFCHHHATAQELAIALSQALPAVKSVSTRDRARWRRAWGEVLSATDTESTDEMLRDVFADWLCADQQIRLVQSWIGTSGTDAPSLKQQLTDVHSPSNPSGPTILESAKSLLHELVHSPSSNRVLRNASADPSWLPAGGTATDVLALSTAVNEEAYAHLFSRNTQPDTVMAIFNSPFGPRVLVVTDKMSEGVDLHRHCRHLVHYELDPSPIRTVQRNGRLRRVNCWAAVTGQPLRIAYPAYRGTRDHRLVEIMKKRLDSFSLLLGGVRGVDLDEGSSEDEQWRANVLQLAKKELEKVGRRLRV